MTESHPNTAKPEEDRHKKGRPDPQPDSPPSKPAKLDAVGQPEPPTEQPVAPHHPDKPIGERQDGAGPGPERGERHEDHPAGATHARRKDGPGADQGQPEEPDAAHRGQPALLKTGEAQGSGASAGGSRHGAPEEPATDSAGGAGRD